MFETELVEICETLDSILRRLNRNIEALENKEANIEDAAADEGRPLTASEADIINTLNV